MPPPRYAFGHGPTTHSLHACPTAPTFLVFGPVRFRTWRLLGPFLEGPRPVHEVRVVPVGLGVVEHDPHAMAGTGGDPFSDEIASEWRVGDPEVGQRAVEEAEAVMMLAGYGASERLRSRARSTASLCNAWLGLLLIITHQSSTLISTSFETRTPVQESTSIHLPSCE